jgi:hypothetical protein
MAANGLKVFKILTFGPISKHWNLAILANQNLSIFSKFELVGEPEDAELVGKIRSAKADVKQHTYPG